MSQERESAGFRYGGNEREDVIPRGTLVADGRYSVGAPIGRGGMATVYAAKRTTDGTDVALKVLAEKYAKRQDIEQRLRNELVFAARLDGHPNIVRPLEGGQLAECEGVPYLVTELVRGPALTDMIVMQRHLPPLAAAEIALDVATALAALHAIGIVHRDVKPDNVVVAKVPSGKMQAKLIDFGLAGWIDDASVASGGVDRSGASEAAKASRLTAVFERPGTRHYMAPEQAMGAATAASFDVWALGATLYEMLVGSPPFGERGEDEVMRLKVSGAMPEVSLASMRPDLPGELVAAVDAALRVDPANRCDAVGLRAALEGFVAKAKASARASAGKTSAPRVRLAAVGGEAVGGEAVGGGGADANADPDAISSGGGDATSFVSAADVAAVLRQVAAVKAADAKEAAARPVSNDAGVARLPTELIVAAASSDATGVAATAEVEIATLVDRGGQPAAASPVLARGSSSGAPVVEAATGQGGPTATIRKRRRWVHIAAILGLGGLVGLILWARSDADPERAGTRDPDAGARTVGEASVVAEPKPGPRSAAPVAPAPIEVMPAEPAPTDPAPAEPSASSLERHDPAASRPRPPIPKPKPRPIAPAIDTPDPANTAECAETRIAAKSGLDSGNATAALRPLARTECWSDRLAHRRMLVSALLQAKKYDRCVRIGSGSTDARVREVADLCAAMLEGN